MNANSETSIRVAHATVLERHQEARRRARSRAARAAAPRRARASLSVPPRSPLTVLGAIVSRLAAASRAIPRSRRLPPCEGCA